MYILKNLRDLILNSKIISALLVICIIVSTLIIQFSYGIYQNYHVIIERGKSEYREIYIEFENGADDYVKLSQVLYCVYSFSSNLYESIDYCSIGQDQQIFRDTYKNMDYIEDENGSLIDPAKTNYFYCSFKEDGTITYSDTIKNNCIRENLLDGRWFTEEEWDNREKLCIVGLGNGTQRIQPFINENGVVYNIEHDGVVETNKYTDEFGDTYKIIGVNYTGTNIFPVFSVNQNYRIDSFFLEMFQPITSEQYKELCTILETNLGNYVKMPDIEFTESRNIYLYNTILIICGLVSLAAGINFIILFHFIMMKRRKKLAIFRLCGYTYIKCIIMCLSECLILTVPLYVISTFVYDKFIVSAFSDLYPYMESANSLKIYLILGVLYIGITTIITLIMLIKDIAKTSIVSIQKGRS
ncbi:MAG: hypothetical protein GX567_06175 [Clostridia bacterium]|nr:hypothetical protein [Clostridia bacterium]